MMKKFIQLIVVNAESILMGLMCVVIAVLLSIRTSEAAAFAVNGTCYQTTAQALSAATSNIWTMVDIKNPPVGSYCRSANFIWMGSPTISSTGYITGSWSWYKKRDCTCCGKSNQPLVHQLASCSSDPFKSSRPRLRKNQKRLDKWR